MSKTKEDVAVKPAQMTNKDRNRIAWKMFSIDGRLAGIIEQAQEEGELSDALVEQINKLEVNRDLLMADVCRAIVCCDSDENLAKAELARLTKMKGTAVGIGVRLKMLLKATLTANGQVAEQFETYKVRIQLNGQSSMTIADESKLPEWAFVTRKEVSKTAIAERYSNGEPLPEGVTIERGTHIRIS